MNWIDLILVRSPYVDLVKPIHIQSYYYYRYLRYYIIEYRKNEVYSFTRSTRFFTVNGQSLLKGSFFQTVRVYSVPFIAAAGTRRKRNGLRPNRSAASLVLAPVFSSTRSFPAPIIFASTRLFLTSGSFCR